MNLRELLDELRVGILNDRTDRVSGTSDYLWTDARLTRYINEAQRRFAVQGLVLRDATTPECCEVTLVEGQSEYPLHPAVLGVITARISDQMADLPRLGHSTLAGYQPAAEQWRDTSGFTGLPPGRPLAWSTDEGLSSADSDSTAQVVLRVYPVPSAAEAGTVLKLRVVRKPLDQLTINSPSAVPEIPEDHHIEMLDWAAYLALRIVDDDAGAPRRAQEFAQSFEVHVNNARKTAMRKLFAPAPWGFGRGGWRWEA